MIITDEQLTQWEEAASSATPGPWEVVWHDGITYLFADNHGTQLARFTIASQNEAELCALARTALPAACAEIRRLNDLLNRADALIQTLEAPND